MNNSNLLECRKSNGMTQKEVAEILGITKAAYSNIETGKRNPSLSVAVELQRIFGETIDYLLNATLR